MCGCECGCGCRCGCGCGCVCRCERDCWCVYVSVYVNMDGDMCVSGCVDVGANADVGVDLVKHEKEKNGGGRVGVLLCQ